MNLIKKIKSYFSNYIFIEPLAIGKSYSTNIKIQRTFDKSIWVGKISNPLPISIKNFRCTDKSYIRKVNFVDLDDRAMLGFRLANLAGLKSLKAKIVSINRIENFDIKHVNHQRVNDNIFLTKFSGESLEDYLQSSEFSTFEISDVKNKDEVIKSFVFNLWIGNYDNKDRDYLVDDSKNLVSIDYHLLGPGFKSNPDLSLGAWGEAFDFNSPSDTGWCIGNGQLLNYLKNHINDGKIIEQTINKICSISDSDIKFAMKDLKFFNQGTKENINNLFFNFLLERRQKLREKILIWINADFPLTPLPKDNGVL
jgi:hypothetical protein